MYNVDLREYDHFDDDLKYDDCGSSTVAVLKVGSVKIPLCWDCVNELHEELTDFIKPHYCFQCKHWKPSRWGYNHSGSCCKDGDVTEDSIGYKNPRYRMEHCKDFMIKEHQHD